DYRLTYPRTISAIAGRLNDARDFVPHHARLGRPIGVKTLARENVCKVQSGGFHAHQDLARSRIRIRPRFHFHDASIPVRGSEHGANAMAFQSLTRAKTPTTNISWIRWR